MLVTTLRLRGAGTSGRLFENRALFWNRWRTHLKGAASNVRKRAWRFDRRFVHLPVKLSSELRHLIQPAHANGGFGQMLDFVALGMVVLRRQWRRRKIFVFSPELV